MVETPKKVKFEEMAEASQEYVQSPTKMEFSAINSDEHVELKPMVWKNLPSKLLQRVVLRIELPRLVTFRVVCKLRNAFTTNPPPHIDLPARRGADRLPALLYWGPLEVQFGSDSAWVQTMVLSKIKLAELYMPRPASFPIPAGGEDLHLLASEAGLLCFTSCSR